MKGSTMILTVAILVVVAVLAVLTMPAKEVNSPTASLYQEEVEKMENQEGDQEVIQEEAEVDSNYQVKKSSMDTQQYTQATITTNKGEVVLELFSDKAPNTVANFGKLASEGFYDGVRFHRVIQGFMIQSGDPQSKESELADMWGTGGPGYKFDDELPNAGEYELGSLAMANSGPNTNGSQFFIVSGPSGEGLPPLYSLFGKVTKGMDVVTAISNVDTDGRDRPLDDVIITSITVK